MFDDTTFLCYSLADYAIASEIAAATSAVAILRAFPPSPEEQGGDEGRRKRVKSAECSTPAVPLIQLSSSWCVCIECSSSSAGGGGDAARLMAHDLATIKGAKVCTLSRLSSYILQYDGGAVSFAALSRPAPKSAFAAGAAAAAAGDACGHAVESHRQRTSSDIRQQPAESSVLDEEQEDGERGRWCSVQDSLPCDAPVATFALPLRPVSDSIGSSGTHGTISSNKAYLEGGRSGTKVFKKAVVARATRRLGSSCLELLQVQAQEW